MEFLFLLCLSFSPIMAFYKAEEGYKIPPPFLPEHTRLPGGTSTARFEFEGVDYDLLPPNLHEQNNDCHSHFNRCIRYQTFLNPVCGFNLWTFYFDDYYSPCQIELENCIHRRDYRNVKYYWIHTPMKGNNMKDDKVYYNGEGFDCKFYARQGGNMMDAYLKNSARRISDFKNVGIKHYRYLNSRRLL